MAKNTFCQCRNSTENDNGSLNNEYSSGDGIHLTGAAYDEMLKELENYLYK